jgi:hypothetical protein
MKKMLVAMVTVVAVLLALSMSAYAGPPVEVEGDFVYIPDCHGERWANDNQFLYCTDTAIWTGDFVGTSTEEYVAVLHGSSGGFVFEKGFYKGIATFTGTVAGREGTLKILFRGKSPGAIDDWTGTWRIISGTGELANLHGKGDFWNNALADIHYEGRIHFDPKAD